MLLDSDHVAVALWRDCDERVTDDLPLVFDDVDEGKILTNPSHIPLLKTTYYQVHQ